MDDYFAGKNPDPSRLTLVPYGTAFQRKVWKVLAQIPYGETMTYGEIAEKINCGSAQALVGLLVKIPCLSLFLVTVF